MSRSAAPVRVKICGITNRADAEAAIESGADALGFNFFPGSKRYVRPAEVARWIGDLPRSVLKVAVVVDPTLEEAIVIGELPGISGLQLHGHESPEFCRQLRLAGIRFAKVLPVRDGSSLRELPDFSTRTFVLDSLHAGVFGGSGKTFPWVLAADFVLQNSHRRIVLAGGLTVGNVAEALRIVRPFGADVTSGVESSAGRKDHQRLRDFIAAAKSA